MKNILTKFNISIKEWFVICIIGFFIHYPVCFYNLLECDELGNSLRMNTIIWDTSLGRFVSGFYKYVSSKLGFTTNITYYNLVIFIITFSIAIILFLNILHIDDKINRYLLAFIFMASPPIVTITIFRHGILLTGISYILPAIGIYLILDIEYFDKFVYKKIAYSYLVLLISLGLSQHTLAVYIVLLLFILISYAINGKYNGKKLFKIALIHFIFLVITISLYILLMFIINKILGLTNSKMSTTFDLKDTLTSLFKSYARYGQFLIMDNIMSIGILHKLCYLILYIEIGYLMIKVLMNKNSNKILFLVFMILLPIGLSLTMFMARNGVAWRNLFTLMFIFTIPSFLLYYNELPINIKNKLICMNKFLLLLFAIIFFYIAENKYQVYHNNVESTKSYAIELVSRVKNTKGYKPDLKWCFIGDLNNINLSDYYSYDDNYSTMNTSWSFIPALQEYAATKINLIDNVTKELLINKDEVKNMPSYPNYDGVKIIDNVIIVKVN